MARRRKTSLIALQEISEINMTPLMDLTFILLITFIITFPLIEQGIAVSLPSGQAEELTSESRSITIDAQGNLYLDDLPIRRDELVREMEMIGGLDSESPVYVRADKSISYEKVADLMVILHNADITKLALVTEE